MSTTDTLDAVREVAADLSPDDRATALHEAEIWRDSDDRRTYAPRRAFDALTEVIGVPKPYGVTRPEYVAAVLETLDPEAPLPEDPGERVARQLGVNYERRVALLTALGTVQNAPDPRSEERTTPRPEAVRTPAPAPDDLAAAVLALALDPDAASFALDVARTWQGLDRLVPSDRSDAARDYLAGQLAALTGYPVLNAHTRDNVRTIATTLTTRSTR